MSIAAKTAPERQFQVTDDPVDDRRLGQEELIG
jgi:hypothetical protein